MFLRHLYESRLMSSEARFQQERGSEDQTPIPTPTLVLDFSEISNTSKRVTRSMGCVREHPNV